MTMISSSKHRDRDFLNELESRSQETTDIPESSLEQKVRDCSLTDINEKDDQCNGIDQERKKTTQERFRVRRPRLNSDSKPRSFPMAAAMSSRPVLQKKSFSDLASYRNVHMKILVEGREVLDTRLQGEYCFDNGSPQEQSTDEDNVTSTLGEHEKTKKPGKILAGWFTKKTQSKTQNSDKNKEPPIGFRSLKRSKSFSVRIKDKIKSINPSSGSDAPGSPEKPNNLQSPLFYKIIELQDLNDHEDVKAFRRQYPRRHSDQTDAMSRRVLGSTKYDFKSQKYYTLSLGRGLKQHSPSNRTVRKKSNSLEAPLEFPFWSQISDASRSQSCSARIRVSETRRDSDGTLETNLCSTEL